MTYSRRLRKGNTTSEEDYTEGAGRKGKKKG